jgi:hypothetical protein
VTATAQAMGAAGGTVTAEFEIFEIWIQ